MAFNTVDRVIFETNFNVWNQGETSKIFTFTLFWGWGWGGGGGIMKFHNGTMFTFPFFPLCVNDCKMESLHYGNTQIDKQELS